MTTVQLAASNPSRSLEGISCVVIGMLLFVGQDAMMKFMLEIFPIWILMAARGLIALVVLTTLILWLGAPHRLFTTTLAPSRPARHFAGNRFFFVLRGISLHEPG